LDFKTEFFENSKAIDKKILKKGYGIGDDDEDGESKALCLGVIFDDIANQQYQYRMMYNLSANPDFRELLGFNFDQIIPFEQENDDFYERHTKNGHFYL